jgi:hypothetical protein
MSILLVILVAWLPSASPDIDVGTSDVEGVDLVLRPTASLRARLVAGGLSLGPSPIILSLAPADRSVLVDSAPVSRGTSGRVGADGTMLLTGIAPGHYRLNVTSGSSDPMPWVVQSVTVDGVALRDGILDVQRSGNLGDAVIQLRTR